MHHLIQKVRLMRCPRLLRCLGLNFRIYAVFLVKNERTMYYLSKFTLKVWLTVAFLIHNDTLYDSKETKYSYDFITI